MTVREASIKANGECVTVKHPKKDGFLHFRMSEKGVAKGKIVYDDTTLESFAWKSKMPKWIEKIMDSEVNEEDRLLYEKYRDELLAD